MTESQTARELIGALDNTRWRDLLSTALEPERRAPEREYGWFWQELQAAGASLAVTSADAVRLVQIAMTIPFPADDRNYSDPGEELLSWLWAVRLPTLVDAVVGCYAHAAAGLRRSAFTLLGCQRSEAGARAIVDIVRKHGLPEDVHARFFREISETPEHALILLPDLLIHAGKQIAGVVDFVNVARRSGTLDERCLDAAAPTLIARAAQLFPTVKSMQRSSGVSWRFDDDYAGAGAELGALLDALAHIPASDRRLFDEAITFADPRLRRIAAMSLLARGIDVPGAVFEAIARSPGERADLFLSLQARNRLDLFPAQFATLEAFAASEMVSWLRHPSELGYEPEHIELMSTLTGTTPAGVRKWCLWRFQDAAGTFYAGVSGPYELDVPTGPVHGEDTFSRFDEWDSASPEDHLRSVRETLEHWRIAHLSR